MKDEQGSQYAKHGELKGKGGRDQKAFSSETGGGSMGQRKGSKLDSQAGTGKKDESCYKGCEDVKVKGY